ncbi:hypothetical protein ACHWQZ_G000189 [Mnemiopsis leidyi]
MRLLVLVLILISSSTAGPTSWDGDITEGSRTAEVDATITGVATDETAVFKVTSSCTNDVEATETYLQLKLFDTSTLMTVIYKDLKCDEGKTIQFSKPFEPKNSYKFQAYGESGTKFSIEYELLATDVELASQKGQTSDKVSYKSMVVKSFKVSDDDIKPTSDWSYIQISVESDDQFFDPTKTETLDNRLVARLMVTNNSANLQSFYTNPNAALDNALRLSFSTFGMITLSEASVPKLGSGEWIIAVVMDDRFGDPGIDKDIDITVTIRTDYQYAKEIGILFAVSLLGIIIPFLARAIFDVENTNFEGLKLKHWLITIKNWFWSGNKGLTYLTLLLACLLIVSAFQVVHAKYADMQESGDRDICFYNEKCFRPYLDHYDVSVNGVASNLPFMVHGVILVLYFSLSEAYCRSKGHEKYFDYSIPYSFGIAFICEGFGSLLYHICPSQIIFQFDTLFMFVISIIMIISIFEGYSIRDNDLKISEIAKHKAIRTPKVFAFFIGPIYFFNFIGNLIETEGLPVQFVTVFYIFFAIWWIIILLWVAYKLDLWPDSLNPVHVDIEVDEEIEIDGAEVPKTANFVMRHAKCIKTIMFLLYCCVVAAGFVMALLQKLSFSIFILGVLIFGQIVLTMVFFIPTIWVVLQHFVNLPVQLANHKLSVSKHFFILFGIVVYVLLGCVVVVISLVFFTVFSVTDKSIYPWRSREQNSPCYLGNFYDTHDFWHLFASFALMMMAMVVVQISKPCRKCYLEYLKKSRNRIETVKGLKTALSAVNKFKMGAGIRSPSNPESPSNGAEAKQDHQPFLQN